MIGQSEVKSSTDKDGKSICSHRRRISLQVIQIRYCHTFPHQLLVGTGQRLVSDPIGEGAVRRGKQSEERGGCERADPACRPDRQARKVGIKMPKSLIWK